MADAARSLDVSALSVFRESFGGDVVLPGDPTYDRARVVWNGMVDRRPAVLVRPTGVPDVISAVRFGREQDLVVAVRCGGHSIPGFSTCDDGIVIDLSRMRGVTVDRERRIARVDGGAHLAELDDAVQAYGLVCPVGVVAHTGVAGLTLGGGMGRLQRKHGLTIDNLLAVELVTADGRTIRASQDEHPELFWGLRGAGPNFGIATAFEFQLHPLEGRVLHGFVMHPAERALELAALYRELVETSPDEMFVTFGLGRALPEEEFAPEIAGRPVAYLVVHHCGPPEEAERDVAPMRAFGPPIVEEIRSRTYLLAQHANDEAMEWGHRFYMKSGFTSSFPDEMVETMMTLAERAPGDCSIGLWPWDRAISQVSDDAMAFTGRSGPFWVAAECLWDDPALDEETIAWGRRAYEEAIAPYATVGQYVNDTVEQGEAVVRSVYGNAKYERLVALKREWDPDNVFRLNQNIKP
jgi:FAD/FMN-containing dehydrogenase